MNLVPSRALRLYAAAVILGFVSLAAVAASAAETGRPAESQNMRLIGADDLQARSAYQPIIHSTAGRWIAYTATRGRLRNFLKYT